MSDGRNFAALDWVVHEIVQTLRHAREALEAYVENPEDEARLRFCLTHIHQVHGSLQMVEFHGAAMMAEEMESLTQAMIEGRVASDAEAQEVLMRAILQFPIYLEKVKTSRRDNPLTVLPLLNDLRTVRGEHLLTETNLFSPYLAPAWEVNGARLPLLQNRQQFQDAARKLRQMYQYAAAGFIRGVNADENLGYLQKVFARLYKLTSGTARQPLWHICLALAEALEIDAIESSVSIKNLLRQLDKELKQLVMHGTAPLDSPADTELIKNLLYYVARSGKHAPGFSADSHLQQVYELYELDRALPEGKETGEEAQDMLAAPDAEAMRSVVAALKVELDTIKQALDVSLTGGRDQQALADALPVIKRVADTMAVLGIADLRKQILEQGETIERAVNAGSELASHELMAVAGHMLDIEGRLDSLAAGLGDGSEGKQHDLNLSQAQESVLRESRTGLEQVKDAIIEYIASQWDQTHLAQVPDTLRGIRGGLEMVPMPRPARILGASARYVEEQLLAQDASPEWNKLDTLADAITSVEYYLERFTSERAEEDELLLAVAEDSVAQLGYAVAKTPAPAVTGEAAPEPLDDAPDDTQEQEALSNAYQLALADTPSTDELPAPEEPDVSAPEFQADGFTPTDEPGSAPSPVAEITAESESGDDEDFDEEILEIFVEEAGEVSEAIAEHFPQWAVDFENHDALTEFRRAFHTLKGSGRMVGANDIGELAWSIENMLNRILDGTVTPDDQHVAAIEQVRRILPDMIEAFSKRQANPHPELTQTYADQADALSRGEVLQNLIEVPSVSAAPVAEAPTTDSALLVGEIDGEIDDDEEDEADSQLWEIFGIEALAHLQVVDQYIRDMDAVAPLFTPPSDSTQRALHTLKGSAHMADIQPIAELVAPLERFIKELCTYQVNIDEDILQLLRDAVEYTTVALGDIEQGQPVEIPRSKQFEARVSELREIFVAPLVRQQEAAEGLEAIDPELLAIFMAEEMNLLLDADKTLDQWGAHPHQMELLQPLQAELVTLTNGARRAKQLPLAELADKLHQVYQALMADHLQCTEALCESLKTAHDALLDMVDAVAVGQGLKPEPESITEALDSLLAQASATHTLKAEAEAEAEAVITESAGVGASAELPSTANWDDDEADDEIIEIFVEEAEELTEAMEDNLHQWQEDQDNPEWSEELKRLLHTLKGGARLAGVSDVGDLSHDYETLLISLKGNEVLDEAFFKRLNQYQDSIHKGVERVRAGLSGIELPAEARSPELPEPIDSVEPVADASPPTSDLDPAEHVRGKEATVVPFTPKPKPQGQEIATRPSDGQTAQTTQVSAGGGKSAQVQHLAARRSGPQEVVRVSAGLLEELVNLAGETSITRGRIEEQVGDLGLAIEEMDTTVVRLQEQLRRLDIETEAQVLFRQEQMEAHEEFDPLEMDRYSQLQQLSRSLIESASDLLDLKSTLADKNRDTETLLLQQSRINTDLQEGLMRSRMVPFSRLVPRLRRIVRQAASELGKDVSFELDNVEGELDRSVLERMVAPLEHMLRNAVDHGIETPDERIRDGKSEGGRIVLSLSREGGEVLLRLADDGRGINLDKVRAKAIERGLMTSEAALSDRDVMQFILHAGFSTAENVTQISGRGVGMDVVHSEIKQLGGSMFINSEWGQGTEFIVRLPFTVSVNRALMIQIGDDYYAIPLNTIEGIVRVSPFELQHYYQDESAVFEYAGEQYQVRYLGAMLDSRTRPKLDDQTLPLPVVLVRSAEHTLALQVDQLLGSREIVVKTLGVQFAAVTGVSGATVMGDGSVVVILDPHALMREKLALGMHSATLLEPTIAPEPVEVEEQTVLVVDDSVTVRKVTGRFLEREGFHVMTAKDGVEALQLLQDHIPDIMLLDIEMPRMDGFEVAQNIRTSSRLKDIPIIMITSRTGEKHRDRAFSLGVDRYLGKPYQEDLLLTNIRELLDPKA